MPGDEKSEDASSGSEHIRPLLDDEEKVPLPDEKYQHASPGKQHNSAPAAVSAGHSGDPHAHAREHHRDVKYELGLDTVETTAGVGESAEVLSRVAQKVASVPELPGEALTPLAGVAHGVPMLAELVRVWNSFREFRHAWHDRQMPQRKAVMATAGFTGLVSLGSLILSALWLAHVGLLGTVAGFVAVPVALATTVTVIYGVAALRDFYQYNEARKVLASEENLSIAAGHKLAELKKEKLRSAIASTLTFAGCALMLAGAVGIAFFATGGLLAVVGAVAVTAIAAYQTGHYFLTHRKLKKNLALAAAGSHHEHSVDAAHEHKQVHNRPRATSVQEKMHQSGLSHSFSNSDGQDEIKMPSPVSGDSREGQKDQRKQSAFDINRFMNPQNSRGQSVASMREKGDSMDAAPENNNRDNESDRNSGNKLGHS